MSSLAAEQNEQIEWAASVLRVSSGALDDAARVEILARLDDANLAPSSDVRAALRLHPISGRPADSVSRWVDRFRECRCEESATVVEEFARNFWSLAPDRRRQRHEELVKVAANAPTVQLRLEKLRAGLDVPSLTLESDDPATALAREVQVLFVRHPLAQAVERQRLIDRLQADPACEIILQRFVENFPDLARLERAIRPSMIPEGMALDYRAFLSSRLEASLVRQATTGLEAASHDSSIWQRQWIQIVLVVCGMFLGIGYGVWDAHFRHPAPHFSPPDPAHFFDKIHLEVVNHPDGSRTVEAFDPSGKQIRVDKATKRLLGDKELLKQYEATHKN